MARQYFKSTPTISNIWSGIKHAYNGWIEPKTGFQTGTAPLPGFSRNLVGLGKVVKTVNGINYYKNSAGELKTAQEMAKEIKAAKDALRLSVGKTSPNVQTTSSVLKVPTRTSEKYTQSIRDNISFIEDGFKNGTLKWEDLTWKDQGLWNKYGDPKLRVPRYSSKELEYLKQ